MEASLLEILLYQEESETLDFKRDQYKFLGATDDQKSELLKDILSFANSWRQTDAFILVGVQEVRAGRSTIHGVSQTLLNQDLQEFVNSKTNRPLEFSYAPVTIEAKEIGVITIPKQSRPVFLRKGYGPLQPNVVYIRRGDTTAQADPDEIARMGFQAAEISSQPVLNMLLFTPDVRERLDLAITADTTVLELPGDDEIPRYGHSSTGTFGMPFHEALPKNGDYYRQFAHYIYARLLHKRFGIAVTNQSQTAAQGVLVTLEFALQKELSLVASDDMPVKPSLTFSVPPFRRPVTERSIDVKRVGVFEVQVAFGTIPPGGKRRGQRIPSTSERLARKS